MQRIVTRFLGLVLVAVVGLFAYTGGSGADTPQTGGLTPLAPQGIQEPDLPDPVLFIDGEPVTPFDGGVNVPAVEDGVEAGSGMTVPGFEGEVAETVVEIGTGMPMVVPGFEGTVNDMVVDTNK